MSLGTCVCGAHHCPSLFLLGLGYCLAKRKMCDPQPRVTVLFGRSDEYLFLVGSHGYPKGGLDKAESSILF